MRSLIFLVGCALSTLSFSQGGVINSYKIDFLSCSINNYRTTGRTAYCVTSNAQNMCYFADHKGKLFGRLGNNVIFDRDKKDSEFRGRWWDGSILVSIHSKKSDLRLGLGYLYSEFKEAGKTVTLYCEGVYEEVSYSYLIKKIEEAAK